MEHNGIGGIGGNGGWDQGERTFAERLGARLRAVRTGKGLSLLDVQQSSQDEFKSSVLGAYERGERAISTSRLERLARLYGTAIDELLPPERPAVISLRTGDAERTTTGEPLTIDLRRLQGRHDLESERVQSYVEASQLRRRDRSSTIVTIRRDDLRAIAAILGTDQDGARRRLEAMVLLLVHA